LNGIDEKKTKLTSFDKVRQTETRKKIFFKKQKQKHVKNEISIQQKP
jgi:hypothetical protein